MMAAANHAKNCRLDNVKLQKEKNKIKKNCNIFDVLSYSGWWPFMATDGKRKLAV